MDFFFTVMQAIPWNKISLVAIKFYLKILSTSADLKEQIVWTTMAIIIIGYSIQGLVE